MKQVDFTMRQGHGEFTEGLEDKSSPECNLSDTVCVAVGGSGLRGQETAVNINSLNCSDIAAKIFAGFGFVGLKWCGTDGRTAA